MIDRKGTGGWALRHFRAQVLPGLYQDLDNRKEHGLHTNMCTKVQIAMQEAVHHLQAAIASTKDSNTKLVLQNVYDHLSEVRDSYVIWNDAASPTERDERLRALKRARKIFTNDLRNLDLPPNADCHRDAFDTVHDRFWTLCSAHPDIFRNWKASLRRYRARLTS